MSWKKPSPEKWMRFDFIALVIVGIVSTVVILLAKLK